MRKVLSFGAVFVLCAMWGFSLQASEETPEARAAYRRSTSETLIANSQRETAFSRSADGQHSKDPSDLFPVKKNDLFILDSDNNTSAGDVVEA